VSFNRGRQEPVVLFGGFAHAIGAGLTYALGRHVRTGATYGFRHADIAGTDEIVKLQDALGVIEADVSPTITVSGAVGSSRIDDSLRSRSLSGATWRVGVVRRTPRATVDASYFRSLIPSWGFGGTLQDEEAIVSLHMPISKNRAYWEGAAAWRNNDPLTANASSFRSVWLNTTVGYAVERWLRIEGLYTRSTQDAQVPGGRVIHNRVGFQIVTSAPTRISR
jgi:hypothetical protein